VKHRRELFFLAVILSPAVPAFADQIPADLRDGDRGSASVQLLPSDKALQGASGVRKFSLATFKEGEYRIEFTPATPMSDFGNDSKIADLGMLLSSGLGSNGHQVNPFDLRFNHGEFWGRDGGRDWDNHRRRGRDGNDGALSAAVTPEPGSRTLLVFGLAGLAMITYRRNSLKSAI
jgi:hypothetical protein